MKIEYLSQNRDYIISKIEKSGKKLSNVMGIMSDQLKNESGMALENNRKDLNKLIKVCIKHSKE